MAQYVIHLQRQVPGNNDHLSKLRLIHDNDNFLACPASFALSTSLKYHKILNLKVRNFVVEFHLRWVGLKPVFTKCVVSHLFESHALPVACRSFLPHGMYIIP